MKHEKTPCQFVNSVARPPIGRYFQTVYQVFCTFDSGLRRFLFCAAAVTELIGTIGASSPSQVSTEEQFAPAQQLTFVFQSLLNSVQKIHTDLLQPCKCIPWLVAALHWNQLILPHNLWRFKCGCDQVLHLCLFQTNNCLIEEDFSKAQQWHSLNRICCHSESKGDRRPTFLDFLGS